MNHRVPATGFTLVELMVTVAMIGVLAVIAIPSVMEAMQKREVVQASQAALDLVEYARVQAAARNRAYALRVSVASGGTAGGRIQLWENTTSSCFGFNAAGPGGETSRMVRELDLSASYPTVVLFEVQPQDLPNSPLCIKPDGRVFQVVNDATAVIIPSGDNFAGGDARIRFQRLNKIGRREGPVHALAIPFNGLARVVVE
ncbi:prepilin-type N-terminal cleavage/methylation domain-containing protein [Myxococcota bacterium]|nr:prepilin-type N-terminal cleavage/methylation domain-containing protein [Myxococcota bacterium]